MAWSCTERATAGPHQLEAHSLLGDQLSDGEEDGRRDDADHDQAQEWLLEHGRGQSEQTREYRRPEVQENCSSLVNPPAEKSDCNRNQRLFPPMPQPRHGSFAWFYGGRNHRGTIFVLAS